MKEIVYGVGRTELPSLTAALSASAVLPPLPPPAAPSLVAPRPSDGSRAEYADSLVSMDAPPPPSLGAGVCAARGWCDGAAGSSTAAGGLNFSWFCCNHSTCSDVSPGTRHTTSQAASWLNPISVKICSCACEGGCGVRSAWVGSHAAAVLNTTGVVQAYPTTHLLRQRLTLCRFLYAGLPVLVGCIGLVKGAWLWRGWLRCIRFDLLLRGQRCTRSAGGRT